MMIVPRQMICGGAYQQLFIIWTLGRDLWSKIGAWNWEMKNILKAIQEENVLILVF